MIVTLPSPAVLMLAILLYLAIGALSKRSSARYTGWPTAFVISAMWPLILIVRAIRRV